MKVIEVDIKVRNVLYMKYFVDISNIIFRYFGI